MRVLIDMNLSPQLCGLLQAAGFAATHWVEVGAPAAPDAELLAWARNAGAVVVTHDLDFGILLALTREVGPSVIQVRSQDVAPSVIATLLVDALTQFAEALQVGALVTIQPDRMRARVLPIR